MSTLDATTDLCRLFGDITRVRLMSLLAAEELTVAELTSLMQLAQSRVSTHLGQLKESGLVRSRRAGASTFYSLAEPLPTGPAALWHHIQATVRDPLLDEDNRRLSEVIAARRGEFTWADNVAGRMARHYSPGRTWESAARGIAGLCRLGKLLDVASGDGAMAELLAPRAAEVTCLDRSERVVAVGRERLAHVANLSFVLGDMHALPFSDGTFDQVLLMNALCYASDPLRALSESARVLGPGGTLVGVTLRTHAHAAAVAPYNHVQMGFEPDDLRRALSSLGFRVSMCDITSREPRPPHFEVITLHATLDTMRDG